MSSNTYPVPASVSLPDPQGPPPYAEIQAERWSDLIEATNLGYGTGNLQLANMSWGDDVCITGTGAAISPYAEFAELRLPVLSQNHTALTFRAYGGYNSAGGGPYSRNILQRPGSSTAAERCRSNQINSATDQWWTNLDASMSVASTTGAYHEVEIAGYYSTNLKALSIMALPFSTGWPASAGDVGTTVDGDYTPLAPSMAAATYPLSSAMAATLRQSIDALKVRRRSIMCGIGCSDLYPSGALYVSNAPRRGMIPIFPSVLEVPRTLVLHAKVVNTSASTRYIYVQSGSGGFFDANTAFARSNTFEGVHRVAVAGSFSGWINGASGETFDIVPDACSVAGQSALYPAFQPITMYVDDDINVSSYSMWEEEA